MTEDAKFVGLSHTLCAVTAVTTTAAAGAMSNIGTLTIRVGIWGIIVELQ